jgi:hypothetical protein
LLETLKRLEKSAYTNDDGEQRAFKLLPPLSHAELKQLRKQLPCEIPAEVEEALLFSRGVQNVEHTDGSVDLSGLSVSGQWLEDFAPHAVAIASDGQGNSWSIDLSPDSKVWGPVYFFCHDPPVIVYQFAHADELLQQLQRPPAQSDLGAALEAWTHRIYRENPDVLSYAQALQGDDELKHFAQPLSAEWEFVDLRGAQPGSGFSWGRYGPETKVLRHSRLPIVAVEIPGRPSSGTPWWKKVFGG